jgi:hypothetical protein
MRDSVSHVAGAASFGPRLLLERLALAGSVRKRERGRPGTVRGGAADARNLFGVEVGDVARFGRPLGMRPRARPRLGFASAEGTP